MEQRAEDNRTGNRGAAACRALLQQQEKAGKRKEALSDSDSDSDEWKGPVKRGRGRGSALRYM